MLFRSLRPLGKALNRRPLQRGELNTSYYLILTADKACESAIRERVMELVTDSEMMSLNSLKSSAQNSSQSLISAEILTRKPEDRVVEGLTAKILLEQGVKEANWEVRTREQEY